MKYLNYFQKQFSEKKAKTNLRLSKFTKDLINVKPFEYQNSKIKQSSQNNLSPLLLSTGSVNVKDSGQSSQHHINEIKFVAPESQDQIEVKINDKVSPQVFKYFSVNTSKESNKNQFPSENLFNVNSDKDQNKAQPFINFYNSSPIKGFTF